MNQQVNNKKPNNTTSNILAAAKPNITSRNNTSGKTISGIIQTTNTTNASSSWSPSGYSSSNVFGIVLLVIIILAICGACYWLYQTYTSKSFVNTIQTEVMPDVKDASVKFTIGNGTIPSSKYSNEYSISMWINVADYNYNYGKEKILLRRGKTGEGCPEIVLGAKDNDLIVRVKLQGAAAASKNIVSGFANITSEQVNKVNQPQGNNEHLHDTMGNFNLEGTVPSHKDYNNCIFNMVSGNNIDYPTVKYEMESACCDGPNIKPDSAMTLMVEQTMKEAFKSCGYPDGDMQTLGRVDLKTVTDNSAPIESQTYHNDYFTLISGNNVSSCAKGRIENFTNVDDAVNAMVLVITDICNLAKLLQSSSNADSKIDDLNTGFQKIFDALEASRSSAKTSSDVSNIFISSFEYLNDRSNYNIRNLIDKLTVDVAALDAMSDVSIDFITLRDNLNKKLQNINCPINFDGITEIDSSINFYESFINLMKKSIYAYINNMGHGIRKTYPDLASTVNASCLVDTALNADPTIGTCIVKMIPLQKWVNIIVSVYNQIVDIYVDGQLASSCVLKGFPSLSTSDVDLTPDGGFSGKISRVMFSNSAATFTAAKSIYYKGPVASTSIFSIIPNWVYYGIVIVVILAIGYSFMM
jgi:hypothetical protein